VDVPRLIRLSPIPFDRDLADAAAAIQPVASRGAKRVILSGMRRPDAIAPQALALAQAAGVRFALQRPHRNGLATIVVGPVEE